MKFRILFISVLVVSISVQSQKFTFGQDKDMLIKCIEDYLSEISILKTTDAIKSVAKIVANKFHQNCYNSRQFDMSTNKLFYRIKNKESHLFRDNKVPEQLRISIKDALKNCAERKNLPRFVFEPEILTDFLDYLLVDWPTSLREMVSTHEGRSTLRLYAYSAGARLMSALRYFSSNYDVFQKELRRIWMLRAQHYYDGRRNEVPYIRHRFTTKADRMYSSTLLKDVHTTDDVSSFESRRAESFFCRNPIIARQNLSDNEPTTSADRYFETHIDQCYRILLFILELQLRGVITDEDDIYDGTISYDFVPIFIQEIAWSDAVYQDYLETWHKHLQLSSSKELLDSYSSGSKEELIVLLTLSNVGKTASYITSTNTTNTTLSITTTTKSPDYEDRLKEDGARAWDYSKYSLPNKRFRSMLPKQGQKSGHSHTNCNSYGYIKYVRRLNRSSLTEEDDSKFFKAFVEWSFIREGLCYQ